MEVTLDGVDRIASYRYGERGYGKNARDCLVVEMSQAVSTCGVKQVWY